MAGPLGTRAQRHPVYLIPTRTVGRGGPGIGSPGWLVDARATRAWREGGASWALDRRQETEASSRGGCSQLGRCEGLPTLSPDITTHPQPLSQAWDGNTDKNTNTPGQAGFLSRQKHVNRTGATVFVSHRTSRRGIDQDVTEEVVFFFLFHGNLSQQHYHLIKHFRGRKQCSPKGRNDLVTDWPCWQGWLQDLADRPPPETAFFWSSEQALA